MLGRSSAPISPSRTVVPLLLAAWAAIGGWILFAFMHGRSLRDDWVALPALAWFMLSAVLGSRVWLKVHDRLAARTPQPQPQP